MVNDRTGLPGPGPEDPPAGFFGHAGGVGQHKASGGGPTDRRTFLRAAATAGGAMVLGGAGWWALAESDAVSGLLDGATDLPLQPDQARALLGPYGLLAPPDANGLQLPPGFTSRIVARSGRPVADSEYVWHRAPDGGACFADGDGWVYVSNCEMDDDEGGVGVLRFAADGTLLGGHQILAGTNRNCAGGATPWGTWLSCEETSDGLVYETFPLGGRDAVRREAMGTFRHEAAAVDPERKCVYLTEDQPDGCFYRFVPENYPDLGSGRLEVLCGDRREGQVRWQAVPDPSARERRTRRQVREALEFDGGEGCVYGEDQVWFTTKNDGKIWRLHAPSEILTVVYDEETKDAPVTGLDNLARTSAGELFIAEDQGTLDIGLISPDGQVSVFAHLVGHRGSEITGPAFSPDGSRLYFSSQRGTTDEHSDGYTFEITGPFHHVRT